MLKGKNAVVTGSTSGIGLGITTALAAEGVNILLNGFGDAQAIEKIRSNLAEKYKVKVCYNGADLSKPQEIAGMIQQAEKELGSVDILVNNAGIQYVSPIEDFPPEKWDAIIGLNLTASFHTIRLSLPHMKKKGWGRIVNIASAHALVASPFKSAYVAAKHGLAGLTKTVALEMADHGITANTICPGYVLTPLVEKQIPDQMKANHMTKEEVVQKVLLGAQAIKEFETVEQIGGTVVFLCSDNARTITGTTISIDGGWTAH